MRYESHFIVESTTLPGVRLRIRRMSFQRRLELAKRIRDLANQINFLEAGSDPQEKMTAALLAREVDRIYLEWGLSGVEGLEVDGAPATPEAALCDGPEELVREALDAIRRQCGLTEEERKN
jgi:hypothetical protein